MNENDFFSTVKSRKDLDLNFIEKVYNFAKKFHSGQKRKSGEDYIIHPLWIASQLCQLGADQDSIAAALLHDTVEDTKATFKDVEKNFGAQIYELVHGLTKLSKLRYKGNLEEWKIESFFRMIITSTKDLRIILVKLVDRWHNMTTIEFLPKDKQIRIAKETMDIFVPLADLLGAWKIMSQLEELYFKVLKPIDYKRINDLFLVADSKRKLTIDNAVGEIKRDLRRKKISTKVDFLLRRKYYAYQKMQKYNRDFRDVDVYTGIEVVTANREDCYRVLGVIHEKWVPRFDRIKDYIARPKPNGYSAFHTSVVLDTGLLCDFHIMSQEMKDRADLGFLSPHSQHKSFLEIIDEIVDLQKSSSDNLSFYEKLKNDILKKRIHILTKAGDIIDLSENSCPIDVAYKVDASSASHLKKAIVNYEIAEISHILHDGDIVELIYDESVHPRIEWLKWVKSSVARSKIREYLSDATEMQASKVGKIDFDKLIFRFLGLRTKDIDKDLKKQALKYGYKDLKKLYIDIGKEKISKRKILFDMFPEEEIMFSDIEYDSPDVSKYAMYINVKCVDRLGILTDVIKVITAHGVNILESSTQKMKNDEYLCKFGVEVDDFEQIYHLCISIESINSVMEVYKS